MIGGSDEMSIEKFMKLNDEKRDRIVNAGMQEFRYGFKKGSTDAIAQIANVSKGSLFHYFGTKEQFYLFLIQYTLDILEHDYYETMSFESSDLLENLWQEALSKHQLTVRFPHIYRFFISVGVHLTDFPDKELGKIYLEKKAHMFRNFYQGYNAGLFRKGIDVEKSVDLILWAVEGFYNDWQLSEIWDDHELFLKESKGYLEILRTCFYE